tara:strand:- start:124 stop:432 length:309 start_codon:yes stop_codon:yes gene_type:complete
MPGQTAEMDFMDTVEERKPGFFNQLKQFMQETEGGAVPVSMAAKVLGYSRRHIYELIQREIDEPGTGLRAKKFNNTILVFGRDIDRMVGEKKTKPGRPKSKA